MTTTCPFFSELPAVQDLLTGPALVLLIRVLQGQRVPRNEFSYRVRTFYAAEGLSQFASAAEAAEYVVLLADWWVALGDLSDYELLDNRVVGTTPAEALADWRAATERNAAAALRGIRDRGDGGIGHVLIQSLERVAAAFERLGEPEAEAVK